MPTILEINRELADKLYEEAQRDPQSPYVGKKVGIANGNVVVVSDDWDEVDRRLEQVELDPSKVFLIDMAEDYKKIEYIWRTN
jgi:hypothetical protein